MKRYGWIMGLLVMAMVLAAAPMSASAQGCGGQMDHSMRGSDHMGSSGHMGSGTMGYGQMSGQTDPGYGGNYGYANPKATGPGQPAGTYVPAPSGQTTGNPNPSAHDHNH